MLAVLAVSLSATAQITLDEYYIAVEQYNQTLSIAELSVEGAEADLKRARKQALPWLKMHRTMDFSFRDKGIERPWGWSMNPELTMTVYAGGKIAYATKRAQAEYGAAVAAAEQTSLDVRYEAEVAYWSLSRADVYRRAIADYLAIVSSLRDVVARRFEEGYTAKGDLLQVESRLSDAKYQHSSAEQEYLVALHHFNVLCGEDPQRDVILVQGIMDSMLLPDREDVTGVISRHPLYAQSVAKEGVARWNIRGVNAEFMPSMDMNIYGIMQPKVPHVKGGGTLLDGGVLMSFTTPLYHFGERRQAVRSARSAHQRAELIVESVEDDLTLAESNGWTDLMTTRSRVEATRRSLELARENLEISTYSYNEGLATILDVLQAQLSWLQIYTNAITAQYDYAVAIASYRRVTALDM